jgi:hypothetical protein
MTVFSNNQNLSTGSAKIAHEWDFSASDGTISLHKKDLNKFLYIVNITDNIVIYDPVDTSRGGTRTDHSMNLGYDTSAMSDSDDLLIIYEPFIMDEMPDLAQEILTELQTTNKLLKKVLK